MSRALMQNLAGTLMVPIVLIPVAAALQAVGFVAGVPALTAAGQAIAVHGLPLFFALAVAVGFAGEAMAAVAAAAAHAAMAGVAAAVAGDPRLTTGALGGLLAGATSTWLWHRLAGVRLPEYLALFSGRRLVPTAAVLAAVPLGWVWGLAWPHLVAALGALGRWLAAAGPLGAFVYAALDRLLLPTGLHHLLNNLVEYQLGAWVDPRTGKVVTGEVQRFLTGDPTAGLLMGGFFVFNNFIIPAIALAIAHRARPDQRRRVTGLMVTGLLTSVLTGISEPVEFAFLFGAPALWAVHVVLCGLASGLTYALGVRLWGYAAPMFFINYPLGSNVWWIPALGAAYFALYYALFRFAIARWRLPVLGQVEEGPAGEPDGGPGAAVGAGPAVQVPGGRTAAPAQGPVAPAPPAPTACAALPGPGNDPDPAAALAAVPAPAGPDPAALLAALGGAANVATLTACMTRLRVTVRDPARVSAVALRRAGALGVVLLGGGAVQVVVGPQAEAVRAALAALLGQGDAAEGAPPPAAPLLGPTSPLPAPAPETARPDPLSVVLLAPVTGTVVPLEEVPDPVFASRQIWDGVAIQPTGRRVLAPCAGTVAVVLPGGHAVALQGPGGLELIVHVGLETVQLRGAGFRTLVEEGQAVDPGAELIAFEPEAIAAAGKSLLTPVLVARERILQLEVLARGAVTAGVTPLLRVTLAGPP